MGLCQVSRFPWVVSSGLVGAIRNAYINTRKLMDTRQSKLNKELSRMALLLEFPKEIPVNRIASEDIYKECGPLEEGDLRLLLVHPAKRQSDPLVCTLQIKSFSKTPKPVYAALSYCWGTDCSSTGVYILPSDVEIDTLWSDAREVLKRLESKGRILLIGENLKCALLRLRNNKKRIALWVDAICINQKNNEEKTQQLRQMAQVYLKADSVCVWLGEADKDGKSDRAMDFITEIMDFKNQENLFTGKMQAENWLALAELMRDRWFSRRWVVQEISLAAAASVYCGIKAVQWDDFAIAVTTLVKSRHKIKKLFDVKYWTEGPQTLGEAQTFGANILLRATERLFLRDDKGDIVRPMEKIEFLVTSLGTFDSSNRRDIVYSLAAIASDTYNTSSYSNDSQGNKETGVYKLIIDYDQLTEADFYKHFVHFCIKSSKSLDIICRPWAMPPEKGESDLPSWVRLLRDSEFGEPEEVYCGRKNGESIVGPVDNPRYNASGGKKYEQLPRNDQVQNTPIQDYPPRKKRKISTDVPDSIIPSTIWAEGFKLARIKEVSSKITSGLIPRTSLQIIGWTRINNDQHIVPDHVWSTLIADRDSRGQRSPAWYQRVCLRCLEHADVFNNGDLNIDDLLKRPAYMLQEYLARARTVTFNRKLFRATNFSKIQQGTDKELTTQKGTDSEKHPQADDDLFGLCPKGAVEGDLICILYGCSVPVVLRDIRNPQQNFYQVIGETYTHGTMEGEAMEDFKGREETFELV